MNTKEYQRARRASAKTNPLLRAKYLLSDCKSTDRKRGLNCDLTLEFVLTQVESGCHYCGAIHGEHSTIGLDRIDNTQGHTQSNVISCCSTCNYIRRDMPMEAWRLLWSGLKQIRQEGLWQGWRAGGWSTNTNPLKRDVSEKCCKICKQPSEVKGRRFCNLHWREHMKDTMRQRRAI